MNNPILEEHGYFWWNDKVVSDDLLAPDSAVAGTITISERGVVTLTTHGLLDFESPFDGVFGYENQKTNPNIQGVLKGSNGYVLLNGVHRNGGTLSNAGLSHQNFIAESCMSSQIRFPSDSKEIRFFGVRLELIGLDAWIDEKSIELTGTKKNLRVRYKKPKDVSYKLRDGHMSIWHDLIAPFVQSTPVRSVDIREKTYIEIKLNRMASASEIRNIVNKLEGFIILLIGRNIWMDWPVAMLSAKRTPCKIFYSKSNPNIEQPRHWYEICLRLPQVKDNFGFLFDSWRSGHEQYGPGFYMLLGAFKAEKPYVENKFVNLIWGLESLHRRQPNEGAEQNPLQEKISRILSKHEGSDLRWLTRKLKNASEPSLEERLCALFMVLPFPLEEKAVRLFCKGCADRRNDLSHFGGQRSSMTYDEFVEDLLIKSDALLRLYHAVVLKQIGVEDSAVRGLFLDGPLGTQARKALNRVGLLMTK